MLVLLQFTVLFLLEVGEVGVEMTKMENEKSKEPILTTGNYTIQYNTLYLTWSMFLPN